MLSNSDVPLINKLYSGLDKKIKVNKVDAGRAINADSKKRGKIKELLIKQGWNSEQVDYAIKRSNGKRVGLPEIIHFSTIFSSKEEREVVSKVKKNIPKINRW